MIPDDRLDQLIRESLEWQAEQRARRAPSLAKSVREVSERLGWKTDAGGLVVLARPRSAVGIQLAFIVLLLVGLVAAALIAGSQLINPPDPVSRFGSAVVCAEAPPEEVVYPEGVVYTVDDLDVYMGDDPAVYPDVLDSDPVTLYEDGLLVRADRTDRTRSTPLLDSTVWLERRLTARGIELVRERIAGVVSETGCRELRSREAFGRIRVFGPNGAAGLRWHSLSSAARLLTFEEEAAIEQLERDLSHPESWLPAEAWQDATERAATLYWRVSVSLTPSDYGPGDEITLDSGEVLRGSDPRYLTIVLPGRQRPAEFGTEQPARGPNGEVFRCGILNADEARALAESLAPVQRGMPGSKQLFTDDLRWNVYVALGRNYFRRPECTDPLVSEPGLTPVLPTPPAGAAFVATDPCDLIPASAPAIVGGDTIREFPDPVVLLGGLGARTCSIEVTQNGETVFQPALVTLHPDRVDEASATTLGEALLGAGVVGERVGPDRIWVNECLAESKPCVGAIVAWSDPYFLSFEFNQDFSGEDRFPTTTREAARSFVDAVLDRLP